MTSQTHPLPRVSEIFSAFPVALIKHLRQVLDSTSPSDAFACYCNLLEWLAMYIDDLANSAYKTRPADEIDEKLEPSLREISPPIAFGDAVRGLRAFGASAVDFGSTMPELGDVLRSQALPLSCMRLVRAFMLIRKARESFDIPPAKVPAYLDANLPPDKSLQGKASVLLFLETIIPFRNKGIGHQAEESWFPRDPRMYALVRSYLDPAVDDLLTWDPLRDLLCRYEVVQVESLATWVVPAGRACAVGRPRSYGPHAPLGPSRMVLAAGQRLDESGPFIARRESQADELVAVARYVGFPSTLQSSELLVRRYAQQYLKVYLDRGLVTPTQRDGELGPHAHKLALSERDRKRAEDEVQGAINHYASDDPERRAEALGRLQALVGPGWPELQERVTQQLDQLSARRKDYIFEQIYDNMMMSFEQLRSESELLEADLDTVLAELEQEQRVRRVGTGDGTERARSYFKAQDPHKPALFRAILAALREHRTRGKRGYPEPVWRLATLCLSLLRDDGLLVEDGELESYRDLFDVGTAVVTPDEASGVGEATVLRVGDEELQATTVRELLEAAWGIVMARGIDPSPALPFLMGKTRYLVNREPVHANGTRFGVPYEVGGVVFEGNITRAQAVAEVIRLLQQLGIAASSPEVELPREVEEPVVAEEEVVEDHDEEDAEDDDEGRLGLTIVGGDDEAPVTVRGTTVRQFLTALFDHLIERNAALAEVVPVRIGRIRYFVSEEPYHANGRVFDAAVKRGGYFMTTAFTREQALAHAKMLCERLGLRAEVLGGASAEPAGSEVPLQVTIGGETIEEDAVPSFLHHAVTALFEQELLGEDDIPLKSGRVRYLVAETPIHDHGRDFIRPVEVELGGKRYFIEANVSRQGAKELIERIAGRLASEDVVGEAPRVEGAVA